MSSSSLLLSLLLLLLIINVNSFNPFSSAVSRKIFRNTLLKSEIVERNSIQQKPVTIDQSIYLPNDLKTYQLQTINEYDFDEYINDKTISIALFTSSWCSPCKQMEKTLISTMPLFDNNEDIHFIKIDTDNSPDLVHSMNIRSIPSTVIFKNGKIVSEIIGSVNNDVILQHIQMTNDDNSLQ